MNNARFNLQLSAGQVFGILADNDGHEHAEQAEAIAQVMRHCEHENRAAFIADELAGFDFVGGEA